MLYLASQSPRRRRLLRQLGCSFRVVRSTHQEIIRPFLRPSQNAIANAVGKAQQARLPRAARGLVLGADTFLYFRGRMIGKPRSLPEAGRILQTLSGRSHWVYTGVCLRSLRTGWLLTGYAKTRVTFKPLSPAIITRLLKRGQPLDKAGGYALQSDGGELIAQVSGSRSNVVGLPLGLVRRLLAAARTN